MSVCVSEYLHNLITTLNEFANITVKSQVSVVIDFH